MAAAGTIFLMGTAALTASAQSDPAPAGSGLLRVSVVDAETGQGVPARVELLDEQGQAHIPENAMLIGGDSGRDADGGTWKLPEPRDETLEEALAHFRIRTVLNRYTGTEQFYADGDFEASLPAGAYRIRIFKGLEYRVRSTRVEVTPGKTTALTLKLTRWSDPRQQGWYSGESHVHIARRYREVNPLISKQMQAEDLHVTNLLIWGLVPNFHNSPQYAHGPDGVYREGDYLLVSGQENPRTPFLGHTITLGTQSPINVPDAYLTYDHFWKESQQQEAVSGWAHFGATRGGPEGIAIDLLDGRLGIMEVLQFDHPNYDIWYDTMNLGFRITPVAGTDYMPPTTPHLPGRERFYTRVEGPLSFESWLEGVRGGRTFVTNGPLLEFSVQGKGPGDEIRLSAPGELAVEGVVRFDPERDQVERFEFVVNGEVVQTFHQSETRPDGIAEIRARLSFPASETCWIAVRASGEKLMEGRSPYPPTSWRYRERSPAAAHTGAVYVSVEGTPDLAEQRRGKIIAGEWFARLVDLERRLRDDDALGDLANLPGASDQFPADYLRQTREELLERIDSAKRKFRALAR